MVPDYLRQRAHCTLCMVGSRDDTAPRSRRGTSCRGMVYRKCELVYELTLRSLGRICPRRDPWRPFYNTRHIDASLTSIRSRPFTLRQPCPQRLLHLWSHVRILERPRRRFSETATGDHTSVGLGRDRKSRTTDRESVEVDTG